MTEKITSAVFHLALPACAGVRTPQLGPDRVQIRPSHLIQPAKQSLLRSHKLGSPLQHLHLVAMLGNEPIVE
jgi:hypothetical protein